MTGITFTAEIQDQEARGKLAALVERMDRPIGFYKAVGEHLVNSTACSPPPRG